MMATRPNQELPRAADAVVIGGGIIGAATAWQLARRGAHVALVERDTLAAGASGANLGLLLASSLGPGLLLALALRSLDCYARAEAELVGDVEFRRLGSVEILGDRVEMAPRAALAVQQRAAGLEIEMLSADAARQLSPSLPPDIAGAAFAPGDASLNPFRAVLAFARAAAAQGATVVTETDVIAVHRSARRVTAVETTRGTIRTPTVVDAAGAWAGGVAALVGIDLPIFPVRGQALIALPTGHSRGPIVRGRGPFIQDIQGGPTLIGATVEKGVWPRRTTPIAIRQLARDARTRLPMTATAPVLRIWSGLRPATPDAMPVLGETALSGFYIAGGAYKQGMLLGPAIAEMVACLVAGERPELDLRPLDPARFTDRGQP